MKTEKEQGDIEKDFPALLIERDVFERFHRAGTELVYDSGGTRSRAIILGSARGIETPVVNVKNIIRVIGAVVNAESHELAKPEQEQQVEVRDILPARVEIFHGVPDILVHVLVRVRMS
jgi:hypothetical protein